VWTLHSRPWSGEQPLIPDGTEVCGLSILVLGQESNL
jgi:hypothetical protein